MLSLNDVKGKPYPFAGSVRISCRIEVVSDFSIEGRCASMAEFKVECLKSGCREINVSCESVPFDFRKDSEARSAVLFEAETGEIAMGWEGLFGLSSLSGSLELTSGSGLVYRASIPYCALLATPLYKYSLPVRKGLTLKVSLRSSCKILSQSVSSLGGDSIAVNPVCIVAYPLRSDRSGVAQLETDSALEVCLDDVRLSSQLMPSCSVALMGTRTVSREELQKLAPRFVLSKSICRAPARKEVTLEPMPEGEAPKDADAPDDQSDPKPISEEVTSTEAPAEDAAELEARGDKSGVEQTPADQSQNDQTGLVGDQGEPEDQNADSSEPLSVPVLAGSVPPKSMCELLEWTESIKEISLTPNDPLVQSERDRLALGWTKLKKFSVSALAESALTFSVSVKVGQTFRIQGSNGEKHFAEGSLLSDGSLLSVAKSQMQRDLLGPRFSLRSSSSGLFGCGMAFRVTRLSYQSCVRIMNAVQRKQSSKLEVSGFLTIYERRTCVGALQGPAKDVDDMMSFLFDGEFGKSLSTELKVDFTQCFAQLTKLSVFDLSSDSFTHRRMPDSMMRLLKVSKSSFSGHAGDLVPSAQELTVLQRLSSEHTTVHENRSITCESKPHSAKKNPLIAPKLALPCTRGNIIGASAQKRQSTFADYAMCNSSVSKRQINSLAERLERSISRPQSAMEPYCPPKTGFQTASRNASSMGNENSARCSRPGSSLADFRFYHFQGRNLVSRLPAQHIAPIKSNEIKPHDNRWHQPMSIQ